MEPMETEKGQGNNNQDEGHSLFKLRSGISSTTFFSPALQASFLAAEAHSFSKQEKHLNYSTLFQSTFLIPCVSTYDSDNEVKLCRITPPGQ